MTREVSRRKPLLTTSFSISSLLSPDQCGENQGTGGEYEQEQAHSPGTDTEVLDSRGSQVPDLGVHVNNKLDWTVNTNAAPQLSVDGVRQEEDGEQAVGEEGSAPCSCRRPKSLGRYHLVLQCSTSESTTAHLQTLQLKVLPWSSQSPYLKMVRHLRKTSEEEDFPGIEDFGEEEWRRRCSTVCQIILLA